jgi:hypothetical protein
VPVWRPACNASWTPWGKVAERLWVGGAREVVYDVIRMRMVAYGDSCWSASALSRPSIRALDAKGYVSSGYAVKQLSQPSLILKPNGASLDTCVSRAINR